MGGKFQSEFFHGVPSFKHMKRLVASEEGDEIPWSYGDTQPIIFFLVWKFKTKDEDRNGKTRPFELRSSGK